MTSGQKDLAVALNMMAIARHREVSHTVANAINTGKVINFQLYYGMLRAWISTINLTYNSEHAMTEYFGCDVAGRELVNEYNGRFSV